MASIEHFKVPLFFGLNELDIPLGADLAGICICQNDIEAEFKGSPAEPLTQRRFYVAVDNEQLPAHLGIFRHLKQIVLQDKAYKVNVFEVYV